MPTSHCPPPLTAPSPLPSGQSPASTLTSCTSASPGQGAGSTAPAGPRPALGGPRSSGTRCLSPVPGLPRRVRCPPKRSSGAPDKGFRWSATRLKRLNGPGPCGSAEPRTGEQPPVAAGQSLGSGASLGRGSPAPRRMEQHRRKGRKLSLREQPPPPPEAAGVGPVNPLPQMGPVSLLSCFLP